MLAWHFSTCSTLGVAGASNSEELHQLLLATVMVRRLKADVLTQLPAKRRNQVAVPHPLYLLGHLAFCGLTKLPETEH